MLLTLTEEELVTLLDEFACVLEELFVWLLDEDSLLLEEIFPALLDDVALELEDFSVKLLDDAFTLDELLAVLLDKVFLTLEELEVALHEEDEISPYSSLSAGAETEHATVKTEIAAVRYSLKNFLISNFIKAPQEWGRACFVKFNEF